MIATVYRDVNLIGFIPIKWSQKSSVHWYLVQEALAELVHGALQLATLALPLLVVAHRLGCRPLPCCGSGVVVHVVEPAPLVHSLLPAGRVGKRGGGVVTLKNIFIKQREWVVKSKTRAQDYNQL